MIAARRLWKTIGRSIVLSDIDLDAAAGEGVCLLGTNGSGRSMLLRTLATLVRPEGGALEVAGVDAIADPVAARRRIGYAPSGWPFLPDRSAREHLALLAQTRGLTDRHGAAAALARSGVPADVPIAHLSDGLRQRLALAAALLHSPPVLLLDDPLDRLDEDARTVFAEWIADAQRQGAALVLASNDFDRVSTLCTRVMVLHEGRVEAAFDRATAHARAPQLVVELARAHRRNAAVGPPERTGA